MNIHKQLNILSQNFINEFYPEGKCELYVGKLFNEVIVSIAHENIPMFWRRSVKLDWNSEYIEKGTTGNSHEFDNHCNLVNQIQQLIHSLYDTEPEKFTITIVAENDEVTIYILSDVTHFVAYEILNEPMGDSITFVRCFEKISKVNEDSDIIAENFNVNCPDQTSFIKAIEKEAKQRIGGFVFKAEVAKSVIEDIIEIAKGICDEMLKHIDYMNISSYDILKMLIPDDKECECEYPQEIIDSIVEEIYGEEKLKVLKDIFKQYEKRTGLFTAFIVGIAIKLEKQDKIICLPAPYRHHDVIEYIDKHYPEECPVSVKGQGFVTNYGDYVDRVQAKEIAKTSGQITVTQHEKLFSEDLW